ncbi:MAG TPA: hypothetical protein VF338_08025 [Leptolinea sp.]
MSSAISCLAPWTVRPPVPALSRPGQGGAVLAQAGQAVCWPPLRAVFPGTPGSR